MITMRSYQSQNHSQAREGVELWELGEPLVGDVEGSDFFRGSDTSSSGSSSCSSASLRRLQSTVSAPLHRHPLAPTWQKDTIDEEGMSLREPHPSHLLHHGLTRSCSFGGLLVSPGCRRSVSGGTLRTGWAGLGVLGQGAPPSPRDLRKINALPPHIKVPKTPRPQRASLVAASVAKGVKDCIIVTRKDLAALTRAQHDYKRAKSEGRVYEMEKQMKAAERYLKRLEFLLSQIEDLSDQYSLNQRLRDGVRTMAYAYSLSPGKDKTSALNNVRSGYKECTETLCTLEVQIEQLIGTLTLEMKGIQGFARLCPGDVFEVVIKHGAQKWKTKGRVAKDNSQLWDNPIYVFKSLLGEMLTVKALEVRLLGKTIMIGNKVCETKDLYSPHPQLMTVNLNPSGSLKLNVVITWNPLDGGSEETLVRTPSVTGPSPRGSRRSVIHSVSLSAPLKSTNSLPPRVKDIQASPDCDQDSSFGSMSARSSTTESASPTSEYRALSSSQALSSSRTNSSSPVSDIRALVLTQRTDSHDTMSFDGRDSVSPQCDDTGNFTLVRKQESRVEQWARYSQYNISRGSNLDLMTRSFPNLASSPFSFSHRRLSPAHSPGSSKLSPTHSELLSQSLSHQLNLLPLLENDPSDHSDPLVWDSTVPSSLPKIVSRLRTCLEDIQGQFPQLHSLEEAVLDLHDMCQQIRSRCDSSTSEISLSVESALECFDFLNAECDDDFADDNHEQCLAKNRKESQAALHSKKESAENFEPVLVTSSPQLDAFLLVHLQHSLHLLQDLGSFGPLRRKESESLKKLEREGKLLAVVLSHRHNFDSLKPQHIMPVPHVQVLWDSVASGDDWCVVGKDVVEGLFPVVSSLVEPDSQQLARNVLKELVRQMTDSEIYSDCITVTAGNFLSHLMKPLQDSVPETAANLICASQLAQADVQSVKKGLSELKKPNLLQSHILSQLVIGPHEYSSLVTNFLSGSECTDTILLSLYDSCLLLLESTSPRDRSSAVCLLGHIFPLLSKHNHKKSLDKKTKDESNQDQKNLLDHRTEESVSPIPNTESQLNKSTDNSKPSSSIAALSNNSAVPSTGANSSASVKLNLETPLALSVLSFLHQNDPSDSVRQSARLSLLNLGSEGQEALHNVQLSSNGFQGVHVVVDKT